jgi:tetratricopeptide (TPR) repeat protein
MKESDIQEMTKERLARVAWATLVALCLLILFSSIALAQNPSGADWFSQGQSRYNAKKWPDAINFFSKAIHDDPKNKDAYFYRGDALRQEGKILEAIKDLRIALEMDPECSEAWRSLGKAYRTLGRFSDELVFYEEATRHTKDPVTKRELEKWTQKLREKLNQSPQKAASQKIQSNLEKARAAQNSGDLDKAIKLYEAGLKLAPGEGSIYRGLGEIYLARVEKTKAVECFEKALILDPGELQLQARFASLLYEVGDKKRAATEYERALKKDARNPEIYVRLGRIRLEQERKDDALTCWKKAEELASDPKMKAEIGLLMAQLQEGEPDKAPSVKTAGDSSVDKPEKPLESANTQDSADQFQRKAAAAEQAQEWDQALFFYRKAIESAPDNPDYHYNLGVIHDILGDWTAAAGDYEEALRLNPSHVDALMALGEINFIILEDRQTALKYYKRAGKNAGDNIIREKITKRIQALQDN